MLSVSCVVGVLFGIFAVCCVCVVQLGISVYEREEDYHKCLTELRSMADKVNKEFAPNPDNPVLVLQVRAFVCVCVLLLSSH